MEKTVSAMVDDLLARRDEASYAAAYWGIAQRFRADDLSSGERSEIERAAEILGQKIGRPGWACIPGQEPWRYW